MDQRPVRIVIVGLHFGAHIVEELMGGGEQVKCMELVGVCDLDVGLAEGIATKVGVARYGSLEEVLTDGSVDAVGLYTGPKGRAALLRTILAAGKDVMTTKPFETDPEAAEQILEKARTMGRVIHLNSPSPKVTEDMALLEGWVKEHGLGRAVGAYATTYASYREKADGSWYDDERLCAVAPLLRLGVYLVNDLVRIFGRARSVYVMQTRIFTGRPTSDNAVGMIEFENGALASIYSSFCVKDGNHYRNQLQVYFENGTVMRNVGTLRTSENVTLMRVVQSEGEGAKEVASAEVTEVSGMYDWETFARAVRGEPGVAEYRVEDVVEPLRIMVAMRESALTGARVECHKECCKR